MVLKAMKNEPEVLFCVWMGIMETDSMLSNNAVPLDRCPPGLWPAEPIIRLLRSELCGPPSQAQNSVVKQKHGLFTGLGFPCRCLWPGIVAKCQAESEWTGSRARLKSAIVFPRSQVIRNMCPPLKREACLTGLNFIEHNFNGRRYYTI